MNRLHKTACSGRRWQSSTLISQWSAAGSASLRPVQLRPRHRSSAIARPSRVLCIAHDAAAEAAAEDPVNPTAPHESEDWEQEIEESLKLVALLPPSVASVLENHPQLFELLEVVMDLGRPPIARFPSGDVKLTEENVTPEDIQYAVDQVGLLWCPRAGLAALHLLGCCTQAPAVLARSAGCLAG
jgi:hypothetical protein